MASGRPGIFRRFWRAVFAAIDVTRRLVLNLVFLLFFVLLAWLWLGGRAAPLQANTALVLQLRGDVVEGAAAGAVDGLVTRFTGDEERQTRLRDVLRVLAAAERDPNISRVVLLADEMGNAGQPVLRDIATALMRVRAAGKQVVAWGAAFDQKQYFLAAHADEIYMHPMGSVELRGIGGWRGYYRDALDRLGLTAHVIRAGSFKAAGEQFALAAPSKEAVEADTALYNDLWASYTNELEQVRKLPSGEVGRAIEELPRRLAAVKGDHAQLALDSKWIDGVKTRDELRTLLIERGAADDTEQTFRQVHWHQYLAAVPEQVGLAGVGVGVVIVEGEIADEEARPGITGGRETAERIRQARQDDSIKAVVLRVNSPGGSPFGSELIRRELELTRAAGKPVVVSMGDVAASGGYWVSLASDEIIADPATITGSIGVIAIVPTAEKATEKLSINTASISTTWLAAAYDLRRPLDPRFAQVVQLGVDHAYSQFTQLAATARKKDVAAVDAVAQGRVWSGQQAKEHGLIDTLGGFADALKSAAQRAQLNDAYRVVYLERTPTRIDWLLSLLAARASALGLNPSAWLSLQTPVLRETEREMAWLARVAEGAARRPTVHCLCKQP